MGVKGQKMDEEFILKILKLIYTDVQGKNLGYSAVSTFTE